MLPAALLSIVLATGMSRNGDLVAEFSPRTRVLFQGDSITDMNRGRTSDPNHVLGHSYAFIIGAKAASTYPERQLEFFNRGVSGNKVSDLLDRWQADTIDIKPDILSILVGVNEIDGGVSASAYQANFDRLLAQTFTALPNVHLVLCEPFGLPTGKKKAVWSAYKSDLAERQAIVANLAQKYHATFVKLQSVFDDAALRAPAETWIWDGIHPTFAGQQLVADEWVRTVNATLSDSLRDPSQNSAIDPQVNFERDSYDWLHRHADVREAQSSSNPEVVMIGDSITHFWGGAPKAAQSNGPKAWEATFKGVSALNMGFGWDRTQNVLWRLQHGEFQGLHPKSIVLNIGTNNLVGDDTARTNSLEEVVVGIHAILQILHQRSPDSKIFVMGVFPRGFEKGNELDQRITRLNELLKPSFTDQPWVKFLNIGPQLLSKDGFVTPEILSDGTHPTEAGYAIWRKALKEAGVFKGQ